MLSQTGSSTAIIAVISRTTLHRSRAGTLSLRCSLAHTRPRHCRRDQVGLGKSGRGVRSGKPYFTYDTSLIARRPSNERDERPKSLCVIPRLSDERRRGNLGEAPSFSSFFVETERLLFPHLPAFPSASRGPLASCPSSRADFFSPSCSLPTVSTSPFATDTATAKTVRAKPEGIEGSKEVAGTLDSQRRVRGRDAA
jgi:hypothetical protein